MQDHNASGPVQAVGPVYSALYGDVSPIAYAAQDQLPDMSLPLVPIMPDGHPFGRPTLPDPGTGSIRSAGAPMVDDYPDVRSRGEAPRTSPLPTLSSVVLGGAQ